MTAPWREFNERASLLVYNIIINRKIALKLFHAHPCIRISVMVDHEGGLKTIGVGLPPFLKNDLSNCKKSCFFRVDGIN
jgi:hypothetical protein